MASKIVTNTTGTAIALTKIGVTLQPATPFTIQPAQYPFWAQYSGAGSQVETLVNSGDILVSDGLTPALDAYLGLALLQNTLARDIAFDSRTNSFVATEVQSAIEEAKTTALAVGVLVTFSCLASVAVNDLVTVSASSDNTVTTITDNTYSDLVVGVVYAKPTATTATVRLVGKQSGFSGLTRGKPVFVSTSGTPSTTVPVSGNLQILGVAVSSSEILFSVKFDKVIRI